MELFVQTLVNGLLIGGIFISIAAGFSVSFGVMDIIDFAVGEWVMLGAFAGYWMAAYLKVDPFLLLPAVFPIFFVIGYLIQPVLYRVVSGKSSKAALMALAFTFGMSTFMRGSALSLWSFNNRSLTTFLSGQSFNAGVTVPSLRFAAFVFAVVVTLLFIFFLYRTKTGIAIRGVAQSKPVAGLMGINSQRIAAIVYAIYTGLTATSGVLIGAIFSVNPEMGVRYTIFAFFVVVAAGMGYLPGVVVAGLLLGILDAFVAVYIGGAYTHLVVFLFLYVLLLVAPKGILGRGI